jgi:hypothetical protein
MQGFYLFFKIFPYFPKKPFAENNHIIVIFGVKNVMCDKGINKVDNISHSCTLSLRQRGS